MSITQLKSDVEALISLGYSDASIAKEIGATETFIITVRTGVEKREVASSKKEKSNKIFKVGALMLLSVATGVPLFLG